MHLTESRDNVMTITPGMEPAVRSHSAANQMCVCLRGGIAATYDSEATSPSEPSGNNALITVNKIDESDAPGRGYRHIDYSEFPAAHKRRFP